MFRNVQIIPALAQGNLIQWTLSPEDPLDSTVEIWKSRDGVAWNKLAKTRGAYFFVDSNMDITRGFDTIYKLVLNGSGEYIVTSYIGALPKKDRIYIKSLRRRELLLQNKGGGRPGWLLKKRIEEKCSLCNGEAYKCPSCFGTGYTGGFYKPVTYNTLTINSNLNVKKTTTPIGTYKSSKDVTRGLVYPIVEEGDVWIEKFTDRRYWITGRTELIYRGIPIVYSKLEMSLIPPLSKIYEIAVSE